MPKLLVTGHTGFVGRTLFQSGIELDGQRAWRFNSLPDALDIRDVALVDHIQEDMPDAVLHLAALTNVEEAFRDPDACFDVNFNGTRNLLRALRKSGFAGRLLYVSSGDCYGELPDSALPVNEERVLRPRNPYAVSKAAAEALCYQWSQTEDMNVVIARPFNHIGPGQDTRFAIASFTEQVVRISRGLIPPIIRTGNLDVTRDFTDVRDVLRAYLSLLEHGHSGEAYNVASGQETRLRDVLDWLLAMAGVTASIELDPGRRRAAEQRRVVADVSKIKRDADWEARIPLRDALRVTLDHWEKRVGDE